MFLCAWRLPSFRPRPCASRGSRNQVVAGYSRILEFDPNSKDLVGSFAGTREHDFYSQTRGQVVDLGNNKYDKEPVTFFESGSRLLGSPIEKYTKERIDKQNQENDDRTKKWIKYWKENYRDLDHNCRSVGSI